MCPTGIAVSKASRQGLSVSCPEIYKLLESLVTKSLLRHWSGKRETKHLQGRGGRSQHSDNVAGQEIKRLCFNSRLG